MGDLKWYGKIDEELERLLITVRIFSDDICVELSLILIKKN